MASHARRVADRFPVTMSLNQALEEVRRGEGTRLRCYALAARLKQMMRRSRSWQMIPSGR